MNSSKFYRKSLALLLPILHMIDSGTILSAIAKSLNMDGSHVSYYIRKAKDLGYVKESPRSAFKILELTQAGKNFSRHVY
jgi:predicted transcriptional regulator